LKYIDSQLLNGEQIVKVIPISKRAVFVEAGLMFLPFLVLVTMLYVIESGMLGADYLKQFLFDYTDGKIDLSKAHAAIVTGVLFALFVKLVTGKPVLELLLTSLFAIVVVPAFIITRLYGNERALTNIRLIKKSGILRTDFWDNTLERIQKSVYRQSIMGKIFRYGEVIVTDARGTEHELLLVENPGEITKLLNAQAGRHAFTQSPTQEVLLPDDPLHHELVDEQSAKPQMISDHPKGEA